MVCFIIVLKFNQPLNNWDVSNVTIMDGMFDGAKKFNQCLDSWYMLFVPNDGSKIKFGMFLCKKLINIYDMVDEWLDNKKLATSKYGHISTWNTSGFKQMSKLFSSYRNKNVKILMMTLVIGMSLMLLI